MRRLIATIGFLIAGGIATYYFYTCLLYTSDAADE